jgi:hypothetical protein
MRQRAREWNFAPEDGGAPGLGHKRAPNGEVLVVRGARWIRTIDLILIRDAL